MVSTLIIDYSKADDFISAIDTAKSKLETRSSDYRGIASRANNLETTTSNCSNCAYYLRKRADSIDAKVTKISTLKTQVSNFVEDVEATDKRVANRIESASEDFTKQTGIGKRSESIWNSICQYVSNTWNTFTDVISSAWDSVKNFYENNKYWINIVVDVVLVVAAVAAVIATGGAGIALVVAAFALFNALADLVYDSGAAYQFYINGDEEYAEELSSKGGKDAFMIAGSAMDSFIGSGDFFENAFAVVHVGMSIFAIGYSLGKSGTELVETFSKNKAAVFEAAAEGSSKYGNYGLTVWNTVKDTVTSSFSTTVDYKDYMKVRSFSVLGYSLTTTSTTAYNMLKYGKYVSNTKTVYEIAEDGYELVTEGDLNPYDSEVDTVKDLFEYGGLLMGA